MTSNSGPVPHAGGSLRRKGSGGVWPTFQQTRIKSSSAPLRCAEVIDFSVPLLSVVAVITRPAWQRARARTRGSLEEDGPYFAVRSCTTERAKVTWRKCPKIYSRTLLTSLQVRHESRVTNRFIGDAFTAPGISAPDELWWHCFVRVAWNDRVTVCLLMLGCCKIYVAHT